MKARRLDELEIRNCRRRLELALARDKETAEAFAKERNTERTSALGLKSRKTIAFYLRYFQSFFENYQDYLRLLKLNPELLHNQVLYAQLHTE